MEEAGALRTRLGLGSVAGTSAGAEPGALGLGQGLRQGLGLRAEAMMEGARDEAGAGATMEWDGAGDEDGAEDEGRGVQTRGNCPGSPALSGEIGRASRRVRVTVWGVST